MSWRRSAPATPQAQRAPAPDTTVHAHMLAGMGATLVFAAVLHDRMPAAILLWAALPYAREGCVGEVAALHFARAILGGNESSEPATPSRRSRRPDRAVASITARRLVAAAAQLRTTTAQLVAYTLPLLLMVVPSSLASLARRCARALIRDAPVVLSIPLLSAPLFLAPRTVGPLSVRLIGALYPSIIMFRAAARSPQHDVAELRHSLRYAAAVVPAVVLWFIVDRQLGWLLRLAAPAIYEHAKLVSFVFLQLSAPVGGAHLLCNANKRFSKIPKLEAHRAQRHFLLLAMAFCIAPTFAHTPPNDDYAVWWPP